MALKRNERYPGRFSNPTGAHPQGAFKNRSAPGSQDGSYLEQDWANDWDGFFSSLLSAAGLTANGNVDAVGASQYYTALTTLFRLASQTVPISGGGTGAITAAGARGNLGLLSAATRDVGNSTNNIPDMSFFNVSYGTPGGSGYSYSPNGIVIQWGTIPVSANDITVSFPVLFPTAVLQVYGTSGYVPGGGTGTIASFGTALTTGVRGSFTARCTSPTIGGRYFAIGY